MSRALAAAFAAAWFSLPVIVEALPVVIPNFAVDPTGPEFSISAIDPAAGGTNLSNNISLAPTLQYAQVSQPDSTADTLQMSWDPIDSNEPAQAGWKLVFGTDPDLRNAQISLSVNPPGGFLAAQPAQFVGITTISVVPVDNLGLTPGGWGFNTDQLGLPGAPPPANDPTAAGAATPVQPPVAPGTLASVLNNQMSNVVINVGNGPAAGSARVTPITVAGPSLVGPNFLIPSTGGNLANIVALQYYENGLLRGQTAIPGQIGQGLNNYWDHLFITIIPEPSTFALSILGFAGSIFVSWRRRRRG